MTTITIPVPTATSRNVPAVLTVAGSDSSGGAGIEADLKTFTAHGVYGLTCITALTAQNTVGVSKITHTPFETLEAILKANIDDFLHGYEKPPLRVVKTGMLTEEAISALLVHLPEFAKHNVKMVVDPVMVTTSGSVLFSGDFNKHTLLKNAYLVTPNFTEATILYGDEIEVFSRDSYVDFVKQLQAKLGCENLLVKGGHLPWDPSTDQPAKGPIDTAVMLDVLYESATDSVTIFESKNIASNNTHGTGCTLASAIAANLARGESLVDAIKSGVGYVQGGMMGIKLGHGTFGPLDHVSQKSHTTNTNVSHSETNTVSISDALDYFKTHPIVQENWKRYINHPFLDLLARDVLPFHRFLYYLKQDYYYLHNYAQIHGLAAARAPTYLQTYSESLVIGNIVNEITKHKNKLSRKYNIDYEQDLNFDKELSPGPACVAYCGYLHDIASREDYVGIKVALGPCLFGYYEAALYGAQIREKSKIQHNEGENTVDEECSTVYQEWLDEYCSDWYKEAYNEGREAFQSLFEGVTEQRLEELVSIFNRVVCLEIDFWGEVLESKPKQSQ